MPGLKLRTDVASVDTAIKMLLQHFYNTSTTLLQHFYNTYSPPLLLVAQGLDMKGWMQAGYRLCQTCMGLFQSTIRRRPL